MAKNDALSELEVRAGKVAEKMGYELIEVCIDREPTGVFYVNLRGSEKRKKFVDILEKNGFECEEDTITTRESTIASKFPITVNFDRRHYGHIHNTICASGAASSNRMYSPDVFINMLEGSYSFIIV